MSFDDASLDDTEGRATARSRRVRRSRIGRALLAALGGQLTAGRLIVETPAHERLEFGDADAAPAVLILHRWRVVRRLLAGGDVGFAEAYVDGDWSSPDPTALVVLALANEAVLDAAIAGWRPVRLAGLLRHLLHANTRRGSRRNIARHYDLGNEFYAAWLDRGMTYSGALYHRGDETLEAAQAAKTARVIARLAPPRGGRVLEIGCGWGGLTETLTRDHDCHVTALTLSREQHAYARGRLAHGGLAARADIRLQDYRDVTGTFDRIVSIEMLEAVGEAHWPRYFAILRDRLVAGGVAVLQVITIADARFAAYRRNADFIQRYIFPGGMLPSPSVLRRVIGEAGLVLDSVECFGASYARTAAEWRRRFHGAWPALAALGFTPRFRRMWEYYLAYCEAGFQAGAIDVALYRLVKPGWSTLAERCRPHP
jgi:cyclopropane-fatty-acyl-phospholipid synthase